MPALALVKVHTHNVTTVARSNINIVFCWKQDLLASDQLANNITKTSETNSYACNSINSKKINKN